MVDFPLLVKGCNRLSPDLLPPAGADKLNRWRALDRANRSADHFPAVIRFCDQAVSFPFIVTRDSGRRPTMRRGLYRSIFQDEVMLLRHRTTLAQTLAGCHDSSLITVRCRTWIKGRDNPNKSLWHLR